MKKGLTVVITVILMQSLFLGLLMLNSHNAESSITIPAGSITTDTVWELANGTHYIEGNVSVDNGANLTIEAGVEIRFNSTNGEYGYGLYINNGTLTAIGNPANRIWFTSNTNTSQVKWFGIQVNATGRAELRYCNITYAWNGINILDGPDNVIDHNNITDNYDGIRIEQSLNNTVSNNSISNGNFGIFMSQSSQNHILHNNISNNGWHGLHLFRSAENTVFNNTICDNFRGIYGAGSSGMETEFNEIMLNTISSNGEGIRFLSFAQSNNITRNNISENSPNYGAYMTGNLNNRIHHNIFWNNSNQAYDDAGGNFWDDGYPSGGNYWDDFDEGSEGAYDNLTGPLQNQPGGDGIVDKYYPYIAGGAGVQDDYPLISPGLGRIFVYLVSPLNDSVVPPGTVLDFIVVGEGVAAVNYSLNSGPNSTLAPPWDLDTGTWLDNVYTIDFHVYDEGGNITSSWFEITIDSIPPEINLTSPENGSVILPGTTINLDITDANPFFANYTRSDTNYTLPFPYDIDTSTWLDGDYQIKVEAWDVAGNFNSTFYNFTVDGNAPMITLVSPGNNTVNKEGEVIRFTITDPHLDTSSIVYHINIGGPQTFDEPYNISTSGWPDGVYPIRVNASDTLGNFATKIFGFTVDNTKPMIYLNSPDNNSVFPAGVILDFTVFDLNLKEANYFKDSVGPTALPPSHNINTTGWEDETYQIDIYAVDEALNENTTHYIFTIATLPQIVLNSPANNSHFVAGTPIEFNITDTNFWYANYTDNNGDNRTFDADQNIQTFIWDDDVYTIEIFAFDHAGNINTSWYNFTVDNTPPSIFLMTPENNAVITPGTWIDFSIIETNLAYVNISIDGGLPNPFPAPYSINTSNTTLWPDKTYTIEITVTDKAGQISVEWFTITIDSLAPLIELIPPPLNNTLIPAGTILNFNVTDANLNYTTYILNGGPPTNLPPPWDRDTTGWDGNYIINITAVDLAGLSTTVWFNFTVDGLLPEIVLVTPGNNTAFRDGFIIDFEIYDENLDYINYSVEEGPVGELLPPYDFNTAGWANKIYNITLWAYDTVSNVNISVFTFIVDSLFPEIVLVSPLNGSSVEAGTIINLTVTDTNLVIVNYTVNGGLNRTIAYPHDIDTIDFPDGDVVVDVYALDLAGNLRTVRYYFILNDTTPPEIILNSPANRSHIPAGTVIDLTIFDLHLANVYVSFDGGSQAPFVPPYDRSTSTWTEGVHRLSIYANDTRGNTNTSMFEFTIDSIKPRIQLLSHYNNSVILPGGILNFEVTDEHLRTVTCSRNGEPPEDFAPPYDITASWEDGVYTLLIWAEDRAGNTNSTQFTIIVDSTAPTIGLVSPANNSIVPSATDLVFEILDNNLDNAEYSVNNGPFISFTTLHTINTTGWVDGDYTIRIRAEDPPGNSASASYSFRIDGTRPQIVRITAAEPYFPFNDTIIVIVFSETMNRSSVESVIEISPRLQYTITWSEDSQTLFLKNIEGIVIDETYTVNIGGEAVDLADNDLADYPGYTFETLAEAPKDGDDTSAFEYWWVIPILVAMLVATIIMFLIQRRGEREEPPGEVEMVEDMYLKMRAQEDLDRMKALLKGGELGDRVLEAELLFKKAKESFDAGKYNAVTVYEKTLRDMLAAGQEMEEPEPPPPEPEDLEPEEPEPEVPEPEEPEPEEPEPED